MATTLYSAASPEISAMVAGCPLPIIERYISKVVIELCRRASVWRVNLAPLPLTAGVYNYVATVPVNTVLHNILNANLNVVVALSKAPMRILTDMQVADMYPLWPDTVNTQQPNAIFQSGPDSINVYPVPDAISAYNINLLAVLRPTAAATGWDAALNDEFREVIYHGTLYYLMLMPNRIWTDQTQAQFHAKIYTNLITDARAKANKSYTRANLYARQRPWA